jgi:hypothetical protein
VILATQNQTTILRRSRLRFLVALAGLLLLAAAAVACILSVGTVADGTPGSHSFGKAVASSWLLLALMVILIPGAALVASQRKINIEFDDKGLYDPLVGSAKILWENIAVAELKLLGRGTYYVCLILKRPQPMKRFGMRVNIEEAMIGTLGLERSPQALLEIVDQMMKRAQAKGTAK